MSRTDRILMGPGPSNPYPEVTEALTRPVVGHLDPEFIDLLDEVNERLRLVFQTGNQLTFAVSATGSAGMEAAFVNFVRPGDDVVVGVNGVFGARMCDVAGRAGANVVEVLEEWGRAIDPQRLLDAHPNPRIIAVVHAETSTGVRNDIAPLGAGKGDALLLVDCVTSLGGIELDVDGAGVDIAYSGTQKCLGVPPGLAPLTVSDAALDSLVAKPQSWYLDLNLIRGYVSGDGARAYHHTAPISMLYALHAGLGAVLEEGLANCWARHRACGDELHARLPELGFGLWAQEGHRLPQLTTATLPSSIDDVAGRRALLERYGIEVGGGIGPVAGKVWRIGCMGHTARRRNVTLLLGALAELVADPP
ncbi:alanine--glyoxylate aminotransferase family protein [Microbacterium maritypicum]|uniref:alanine--glyoxylate aminotransferase family protein n=1 Tax=Microbacterium maritypicum TaxID=33918 RepID=UPI00296EC477|nr:alanine--glyoxylate aminotransferase family protein [Microbacterium liquefaciens]